MKKNQPRVVINTNVIISSLLFGGKPRQIIKLLREYSISAVITPILVAELLEILTKKFHFSPIKIKLIEELLEEHFTLVYPQKNISVVRDEDDNRVLEAAIEGTCNYIITGDKDLLSIGKFENIIILRPTEFLEAIQE
jgi:putative PIN family toxin of toxin-antitoxin system